MALSEETIVIPHEKFTKKIYNNRTEQIFAVVR